METKTLTIMFVDLAGYTARSAQTTREHMIETLDTYNELVRPIFPQYGGEIVKEIGDAFMASFESPTNAVLCGIHLQHVMLEHNRHQDPRKRLHIKIAINTGEVHIRDNDVFGDAVNIASRIEKLTKADRIYFTESVFLAMNKNEASIGFVGARKLKGIPRPVKIYTVLGSYDKVKLRKKKQKKQLARTINNFLLFIFILIIAGTVGLAVFLIFYSSGVF